MSKEEIHYVTVPDDVPAYHSITEQPIVFSNKDGELEQVKIPWEVIVKNLFHAVSIITEYVGDIGRYFDLRQKLLSAKAGDVIPLSGNEFAALAVVARKAEGFKDEYKLCVAKTMQSIYESPTEDPRTKKQKKQK